MKQISKPYLYIIALILIWGSGVPISRFILYNLNYSQLLFYSFVISTLTLFVIAILQNKVKIIRGYKPKDYLIFFGMAVVGLVLYNGFLFVGLLNAPTQDVSVANYTFPIWTFIFSTLMFRKQLNI